MIEVSPVEDLMREHGMLSRCPLVYNGMIARMRKEQELFGKDGFEKIVSEVANIEKGSGISEHSQFIPKG
jgi:translation elongation factor EF-1alpha